MRRRPRGATFARCAARCRLARDRRGARCARGVAAPAPAPAAAAREDDDLLRDDRRRPGRAVLAPEAAARLEARRARRPRRRAAQGPPRAPALAAVLRAAVGLPARRRGVAGARRGARLRRQRRSPRRGARRRRSSRSPSTRSIRQVNRFDASPIRNRTRRRARMALTITTGDSADNQQINEVKWVVRLLEGGPAEPQLRRRGRRLRRARRAPRARPRATPACRTTTTCSSPAASTTPTARRARSAPGRATRASWIAPSCRSRPPGLNRPSYVAFGNHDGTVQGNLHALAGARRASPRAASSRSR